MERKITINTGEFSPFIFEGNFDSNSPKIACRDRISSQFVH